jgi:hypothetical protein
MLWERARRDAGAEVEFPERKIQRASRTSRSCSPAPGAKGRA